VLKSEHRLLVPDLTPEKGSYFRSDQFTFARVGVPGLDLKAGIDVVGKTHEWGQSQYELYQRERYHSPADQVYPDWDLRGAAEDMTDLYRVGVELAGTPRWPQWRADSEFRAVREASLGAAAR